jgi:hypothetical protein
MRTVLYSLIAASGLLLATPASALSSWDTSSLFGSTTGQISLTSGTLDLSALLASGELADLLAPRTQGDLGDAIDQALASWGGSLEGLIGSLFPHWRPGTPKPAPAIPEPTAALVFGAGLLLAARRRH